ncbi:MAG: type II toxin-antitoxin system VapC family toxin [Microcystaceae cyanobacterium]
MKILLDTHVWLWALVKPEKLELSAKNIITARENALYLSIASVWEIGIKVKIGKLTLPESLETFIMTRVDIWGMYLLDININHVIKASQLPLHHKDPFDRILIAQSQVENIPILTIDKMFNNYDVNLI